MDLLLIGEYLRSKSLILKTPFICMVNSYFMITVLTKKKKKEKHTLIAYRVGLEQY